jgi:hypothetical protein
VLPYVLPCTDNCTENYPFSQSVQLPWLICTDGERSLQVGLQAQGNGIERAMGLLRPLHFAGVPHARPSKVYTVYMYIGTGFAAQLR